MRSIRTILALAAIFGFAGTSATGTTYYFNEEDGNWSQQSHWTPPGGPPGVGDTAIIQNGQTCHVTTYEDCKILKVLGGATLSLEAPCLLHVGDPNDPTTSIIGGTVCFVNETDDAYAMLTIHEGGVTLSGDNGNSGTLTASGAARPGRILTCCESTQVLTVGPGITVKGHLQIYVHVENNGTFEVDHADDEMIFDKLPTKDRPNISGSGTFDVSAGTLTFDDCVLPPENSTTWTLRNTGTIHVTSECHCGDSYPFYTDCAIDISGGELWLERAGGDPPPPQDLGVFTTTGEFNMTGGTLDADGKFKVRGGAQISGGTIEVAPDKWAEFRH